MTTLRPGISALAVSDLRLGGGADVVSSGLQWWRGTWWRLLPPAVPFASDWSRDF